MKSRLFLPILSMLAMCVVPNYAATAVLSEATETALRAAIAANDVVTIQCEGIILLTNTITISKSVILDATGRQNFGLSGSGSNRVIAIEQGVSAQLVNVSIVDGKAEAGGGILNAGTLLLSGCTLSNNIAVGTNGATAISYSQDAPLATPGGDGLGGAIYSSGTIETRNCLFLRNQAQGGVGGAGLQMQVDAISGMAMSDPKARGAAGGAGLGAAIYFANGGKIVGSRFHANKTLGGTGGEAWFSGSVANTFGAGGAGGRGAGTIYCAGGTIVLENSTFDENGAYGGAGGVGHDGQFALMGKWGFSAADGGAGGAAFGGAIYAASVMNATNVTFFNNVAVGANGRDGGLGSFGILRAGGNGLGGNGGDARGGAVYIAAGTGAGSLQNCTFAAGGARAGTAGLWGSAVNVASSNGVASGGAIYAENSVRLGGSVIGAVAGPSALDGQVGDGGFNVIFDQSSFINPNASTLLGTDPQLGPLQLMGGPVPVMPLGERSLGLDRNGFDSAPATDARGVARPRSDGADCGAVEGTGMAFPIATISGGILALNQDYILNIHLFNPNLATLNNVTLDITFGAGFQVSADPVVSMGCTMNAQVDGQIVRLSGLDLLGTNSCDVALKATPVVFNQVEVSAVAGSALTKLSFVTNAIQNQVIRAPQAMFAAVDSARGGPGVQVITKLNPGATQTAVWVDWGTNGVFLRAPLALVNGTTNLLVTNLLSGAQLSDSASFRITLSNAVQQIVLPELQLRRGVTIVQVDAATLTNALSVPIDPIRFASDGQITSGAVMWIGDTRTIDGENRIIVISGKGFNTSGDVILKNLRFQGCNNAVFPLHYGGAIQNSGRLRVKSCRFIGNISPTHYPYGYPSTGGAIQNGGSYGNVDFHQGTCAVEDCYFEGNTAPATLVSLGYGGAIYNAGTMTVSGCTFANNIAQGGFSGDSRGGAIGNSGSVEVVNCTFIGNQFWSISPGSRNSGSAFYSSGSAAIRFCTFTGNAESTIAGTNITIYGSIIVPGGSAGAVAFKDTPVDMGYNIASDTSGNLTAVGSLQGVDAKLDAAGDYGGATPTVPLKADSPGLDAIPLPAVVPFDQRGVPRPQGTRVDIGAVEMIDEGKAQMILFSDNRFSARIAMTGTEAKRVDATTDFVNWLSLGTFTPAGGIMKFEESGANPERRFYRISPLQP